jgi:hypothetical protein
MKKLILAAALTTMMAGAIAQSVPLKDTNPWTQGV